MSLLLLCLVLAEGSQPLHGRFLIDTNGKVLWQDISADPFDDPVFLQKEALRLLPLHITP
jgi:hypothetical protein